MSDEQNGSQSQNCYDFAQAISTGLDTSNQSNSQDNQQTQDDREDD